MCVIVKGQKKNFSTNVWGINFDIRVQDKFNTFSNLVKYLTFSLRKKYENVTLVKSRFSKKATKFETISHLI